MELDLLERRIKRLVAKLAKQNIHLEVFDHKDIEYGSTLGKGGEGIVQQCTVWYRGIPVKAAVKTVLNNSEDALAITLDEIELLCLAKDPIVTTTLQVYGVAAVPETNDPELGHLVIIIEAGLKNSLQLYQDDDAIPLHVTYNLWSRIAASVHIIHSKHIIHQDLKPENILITGVIRDTHGNIERIDFKVIDLGMGRRLIADKVVSNDILGTNGYHAPEVLFEECYDARADIFMLGITFCVLLLPAAGLRKAALESLLKKIHEAKVEKVFGRPLFTSVIEPALMHNTNYRISPQIRNMICTMLERVDRRHISLLDILSLCDRESIDLRNQDLHRSSSHGADSGIDSLGETMASQRTMHKIGLLEGHVLRQTSPRRLRSNKKRSPVRRCSESSSDDSHRTTPTKKSPPRTAVKRRRTVLVKSRKPTARRVSISSATSTSSVVSHRTTPKRRVPPRNCRTSMPATLACCRETRQRTATTLKRSCDAEDSGDEEVAATPTKRRVLRSTSHCC